MSKILVQNRKFSGLGIVNEVIRDDRVHGIACK